MHEEGPRGGWAFPAKVGTSKRVITAVGGQARWSEVRANSSGIERDRNMLNCCSEISTGTRVLIAGFRNYFTGTRARMPDKRSRNDLPAAFGLWRVMTTGFRPNRAKDRRTENHDAKNSTRHPQSF
jgi:hypothetical protein